MLEKFRKAKAAEVAELLSLAKKGQMPLPFKGLRPHFTKSLKNKAPLAVIAEYKRASPSKGDICLSVEPEDVAAGYAAGGAGAISVLTEEVYFKGSLTYLDRMTGAGLPLLRKDFLVHPLQVEQTAASKASAFLLIVRMLSNADLAKMLRLGEQYELEAVVEVFDAKDLDRAKAAGAKIIQVNNRDLDTLKIDMNSSSRLIPRKEPHEFWITASGISHHSQLVELLGLGFDAALIGSSLMEGGQPGSELAKLLSGEKND